MSGQTGKNGFEEGTIVKFKEVLGDEDPNQLYVVLENRGLRLLLGALNTGMRLMPTTVVLTSDVIRVRTKLPYKLK